MSEMDWKLQQQDDRYQLQKEGRYQLQHQDGRYQLQKEGRYTFTRTFNLNKRGSAAKQNRNGDPVSSQEAAGMVHVTARSPKNTLIVGRSPNKTIVTARSPNKTIVMARSPIKTKPSDLSGIEEERVSAVINKSNGHTPSTVQV